MDLRVGVEYWSESSGERRARGTEAESAAECHSAGGWSCQDRVQICQ